MIIYIYIYNNNEKRIEIIDSTKQRFECVYICVLLNVEMKFNFVTPPMKKITCALAHLCIWMNG